MKKILLALGIVCLFISCESKYYSVLVKNDSQKGKTVLYTYNGLLNEKLAPGKSRSYEVEAYTQPPVNIKDQHGIASIKVERDEDIFIFKEAEPIVFTVVNSLPFVVSIKADNYICYIVEGNKNSSELSIPAQEEIKEDLFIYTEKPEFTTTSDYPVKFEWKIIDLEELDGHGKPKKKLSLVIR